MEDKLSFRLATPQDFDEVQEMSKDIYEGHDYLPLKYHHWLKQDNIIVMVATINGKIVGLEAQFVVDDGKTAVSRARRIHLDHRGRSYGTRLSEALRNHVRQIFPNICRERLTTTLQRDESRNYKELLVQHTLACDIDNSTFKLENLSRTERKLESCTREYFTDVILSPTVVNNLFSSEVLVIDQCPFEAVRANIDYLFEDGDELFVEECSEEQSPVSLSHGRFTPKAKFQVWSCSIFAQDPKLFKAHLIQQLVRAVRAIDGSFIFLSFLPESMVNVGKELLFDQAKLSECEHYKKHVERLILYEKGW